MRLEVENVDRHDAASPGSKQGRASHVLPSATSSRFDTGCVHFYGREEHSDASGFAEQFAI